MNKKFSLLIVFSILLCSTIFADDLSDFFDGKEYETIIVYIEKEPVKCSYIENNNVYEKLIVYKEFNQQIYMLLQLDQYVARNDKCILYEVPIDISEYQGWYVSFSKSTGGFGTHVLSKDGIISSKFIEFYWSRTNKVYQKLITDYQP